MSAKPFLRRPIRGTQPRAAFTLIEVLVVVAIIALLIAILLPSLARARELARRTVCSSHMHNLSLAVLQYAHSNQGKVIEGRTDGAGGPGVQVAINPRMIAPSAATASTPPSYLVDWQGAAKRYQIDKELWECPNRAGTFLYEGTPTVAEQGYDANMLRSRGYKVRADGADYDQWIIGIQYFGGFKQWTNLYGTFKSASPVDSNSKPSWALAADSNLKVDTYWGGGRDAAYDKIPPHPAPDGRPAGGNVLTFDGAVNWIPFGKMVFIHSWSVTTREGYWWQADMGDLGKELARRKP